MDNLETCKKCGNQYPAGEYCQNVAAGCLNYIYTSIDHPDGLGTFTTIQGFKYPFPGYPEGTALGQNATVKRSVMATIRLASKKPIRKFLPFLLVSKEKLLKDLIYWLAEIYEAEYIKYRVPVCGENGEWLCKSGRELLRVGLWFINRIKDEDYQLKAISALWCLVMFWEMDSAYRFRGQDIFSQLDQENLKKNPRKEIIRLLNLYLERENPNDPHLLNSQINKAKMIVWGLKGLLFLSRKFTHLMADFLGSVALDEIKPSINDLYWMSRYLDYKFQGLTYEVRAAWKKEEDKDFHPIEKTTEELASVDVRPNSSFYQLDEYKAKKMAENVKSRLLEEHKKKNDKVRNITDNVSNN